eukprot:COSAG01_NODE_14342_length_1466_cov_1.035845_1_plen_343_part_10
MQELRAQLYEQEQLLQQTEAELQDEWLLREEMELALHHECSSADGEAQAEPYMEPEPEDEGQAAAAAAAAAGAGPSSSSSTDLFVEAAPEEAPAASADDDGRADVAGQAAAAAEGGEGAQDAADEGIPPESARQEGRAAAAARAQAAGLVALRVEGHPRASLNGVYRAAAGGAPQHEGWPHYESAAGMHLYYHPQRQQWQLSSEFAPAGTGCWARVRAPEGPVPTGQRTWRIGPGCFTPRADGWQSRPLTLTACATEAELEQHEARLRAEAAAAREAARRHTIEALQAASARINTPAAPAAAASAAEPELPAPEPTRAAELARAHSGADAAAAQLVQTQSGPP